MPAPPPMRHLASIVVFALALNTLPQAHAQEPLPRSLPKDAGFSPDRLERVQALVRGEIEAGKHAGAITLIARHGKIVDFRAYGKRDLDSGAPMEKDTLVRIYSMSKVVTAVAALQLFEQNRYNLDSPVTQWLPELKDL